MRLLSVALKFILACYLANFVGQSVLVNSYIPLIALFAGFIFFFFVSWENKFILLSITIFYPFMFHGRLGQIPNPQWIEMIAPILCLLLLVELITNSQPLFSRKASIYFAAIGILLLWSAVNYIQTPVFSQRLMGTSMQSAGIRSYFKIGVGVTVFLFTFWFLRDRKFNLNKWLIVLLVTSFIIGILRLVGYYNNFNVPFLGEGFTSRGAGVKNSFDRILGLGHVSILGIPILLTLNYKKRWNLVSIILLINFFALLILAGARAMFFGTLLAVLIYVTLINKKYFFPLLLFLLISASVYTLLFSNISLPDQIGRMVSVSEKSIKKDIYRLETFRQFIDTFIEHPVFGKGIGYVEIKADKEVEGFIQKQMTIGGHGAYLSITMIFGIGGIFFLSVMLFGNMYYAFRIFKKDTKFQEDAKLALFVTLFLVIMSVNFITTGYGYMSMKLYFLSGMIAGIKVRMEEGNVELQ